MRAQASSSGTRQSTPMDIAAGLGHRLEQRGRAGAEVDDRNAAGCRGVEDAPRMRQGELAVVVHRQRTRPGVEELQGLRAGLDLRQQVVADHGGKRIAEFVPYLGLAVHEPLGQRVRAGCAALDGNTTPA